MNSPPCLPSSDAALRNARRPSREEPPYHHPHPLPSAETNDELEARMSLHLLRRIQNLARKMECDTSELLRMALHRFVDAEEARLGISPPPMVYPVREQKNQTEKAPRGSG